ncbi:Pycsar system effector family protein [Candidatus Harpocratesius sp.]
MKIKDKNDFLNLAFQNNQEMINFADSKASTALTIQSIIISAGMAGALLSDTFQILKDPIQVNSPGLFWVYIICLGLFLISSIAGIILSISVIYPRESQEEGEISREGTFYFGHIASYKDSDEYISKIDALDERQLSEEYCRQIYQISKIAQKKMKILSTLFIILIGNLSYMIFILIFTLILHLI